MKKNKAEGKWSVNSATQMVKRNGGKIYKHNDVCYIETKSPGLKVLGAIDYLVNYHKHYLKG